MQDAANPFTRARQDGVGGTAADGGGALDRLKAHKARCRRLPASTPREDERLIAQFLAKHGGVTQCPPAYAAPVGCPDRLSSPPNG